MTERRYALRKLETGDYVLPSNDLSILWRICAVDEPTTASDLTSMERLWDLYRWRHPAPIVEEDVAESIIEDDWTEWECVGSGFPTRAYAIEEAMKETAK